MIATLLLAAGASSRMGGRDKLFEQIDGGAILTVLAQRALTIGPVFVTLPDADHARRALLPKGVTIVAVAHAAAPLGMAESLKAGIAALPAETSGVVILPADMPEITAEDFALLAKQAQRTDAPIIRATTQDGKAGHPIYFAASVFPRFAALSGDRGGIEIVKALEDQTEFLPLKGNRARLDLDTPEDWDRYRDRP